MIRFPTLLCTAALLTACARSEPADPTPGEDVQAPAAAVEDAGAEDPTTAGAWEASAQGQSQSVTFRGPQANTLFTVRCDLRGGLVVQRPGLVARGNLALMQLRTSDVVRRLAVSGAAGQDPQVEARVPYNDPLISALLSFDQPLEVRYEALETLVLPPNPIVSDLVRTCQQSAQTPADAAGTATTGAQAPAQTPPAAQPDNAAQPQPSPNQNQQ